MVQNNSLVLCELIHFTILSMFCFFNPKKVAEIYSVKSDKVIASQIYQSVQLITAFCIQNAVLSLISLLSSGFGSHAHFIFGTLYVVSLCYDVRDWKFMMKKKKRGGFSSNFTFQRWISSAVHVVLLLCHLLS